MSRPIISETQAAARLTPADRTVTYYEQSNDPLDVALWNAIMRAAADVEIESTGKGPSHAEV